MCVQNVQASDCQATVGFGSFEQSIQSARENSQGDANSCANVAQNSGCGSASQSSCSGNTLGDYSTYSEIAAADRQESECKQVNNIQNEYAINPYGDWLAARNVNNSDQI